MENSVTVAVCTYGDRAYWDVLAGKAIDSICKQTRLPDQIIRYHGTSLHQARNTAAKKSTNRWIVYCDADDSLSNDYIERMLECDGDVRVPLTQQTIFNGPTGPIERLPIRPLLSGNWIVIGAMVDRSRLIKVGGFRDLPCQEDWDAWIRLWLDGATFGLSEAVYKYTTYPNGRNSYQNHAEITNQIIREYTPIARRKKLI